MYIHVPVCKFQLLREAAAVDGSHGPRRPASATFAPAGRTVTRVSLLAVPTLTCQQWRWR
jgi:hypothetical protein